jgi:hypothetical protein
MLWGLAGVGALGFGGSQFLMFRRHFAGWMSSNGVLAAQPADS